MRIPSDVIAKQVACGYVDLAWIGDHEIRIEYGTGGLLVHAFDHQHGQLVLEGSYLSIGQARAAFDRARMSAVKREDTREKRPFMRHDTSLADAIKERAA